eukprot:CAMPEP_0181392240 /NCGR_PEP_ID=MMETSP1106-20121128/26478_1 /TAXON_ID=81844 /ORGANISM="Mantoniella antarctica, Strain SL-175" /LENGTH=109 /DNA_ID=CAMNT_0023513335 /DNA_START=529 /DNA_END=859 /DNA_ORIENTATION=+
MSVEKLQPRLRYIPATVYRMVKELRLRNQHVQAGAACIIGVALELEPSSAPLAPLVQKWGGRCTFAQWKQRSEQWERGAHAVMASGRQAHVSVRWEHEADPVQAGLCIL